jgi:hypothetical protein
MLKTIWGVSCTVELSRYFDIPRHIPIKEAKEEICLDQKVIEFKRSDIRH